ncbi:hypothetical protein HBI56_036320 [Parastagonospora nodorum]|nr:hypothetical protein HBH53_016730 [Parastagonospora nodorum]KAH4040615.1 hypothetical protein HBI09_030230 [Parastagonospora nodorum]KAH4071067.1 hypothetical protein HBH50_076050 [Parastagonospora nodorum]KAH4093764.1 hypothetical protein HBH48_064300 [Parastagonospora nodorum]KAH4114191.1 hypothetical protein HBH47_198740 [Parastagonospora nodorum]
MKSKSNKPVQTTGACNLYIQTRKDTRQPRARCSIVCSGSSDPTASMLLVAQELQIEYWRRRVDDSSCMEAVQVG